MNVLFLDKEGGYGGSSRSLLFLIRNLDRSRLKPIVLLREDGPVMAAYEQIGVETILRRRMPLYKPSLRKNVFILMGFLVRLGSFLRSYRFLCRLINERGINILHMNHDSFFVYGILLKYSVPVKIVVHMRTMLPVNAYARFQAKVIAGFSDHMIFITENELKRFWELVHPVPPCYSIVFNAAERPEESSLKPKKNGLPSKGFKVLFLGNLTYHKGADRLIKIAKALKMAKVADILFVVCGMDRQRGWSMGKRSMALEAELQGVLEYFLFLGHQPEPAPFLRETDILIRLSRGNDPWGRDIIEALTYGKPVIAIGTYDTFVQNGVNGFLLVEFSATETAKRIVFLAEHPQVVERMRVANIEKAKKLFDGRTNGGKVAAIYDSIMKSSCEFQGRCSA